VTTDTSADVRERTGRWATAAKVAAIAVIAIGLAALLLIGFWYLVDTMASGADLRDRGAVILPLVLALLIIVVGVGALLFRSRLGSVAAAAVCGALVVVAIVGALAAIRDYPGPVDAQVVAVDPISHDLAWRTSVPLTRIDQTVTTSADRITVIGTYVDHGCSRVDRTVTVERTTGHVLARIDGRPAYPGPQPDTDPNIPVLEVSASNRSQPLICQN
jgi:hypothetical protein